MSDTPQRSTLEPVGEDADQAVDSPENLDDSVRTRASKRKSDTVNQEPESPSRHRLNTVNDALGLLTSLDNSAVLRGNVRVHLAVQNTFEVANSYGLNPEQLLEVVTVINSSNPKITQAIRTKLVHCLVPSTVVPQAAVVKVIYMVLAKVFAGPSNLHKVLLRWVLVVFDHLDGYDMLHKLYPLIFSFIDSMRLLPHACYLLFLLTRREDVVLFRVQKLLDMLHLFGPQPPILGLLAIYKVYCPHLVTIQLDSGRQAFFKNTDRAWRTVIEKVANYRDENDVDESKGGGLHEEVSVVKKRKEKAQSRRKGKRRKQVVPEVHSAMLEVQEEEDIRDEILDAGHVKIPYTQIDTFTSFLQNLENIEYPSQMASVLQDSTLQLLVMCDPDSTVMARLSLWIQHMFALGFNKSGSESDEELLKMLLRFSQRLQPQGLPGLEAFLINFLQSWDGVKHAPVILSIISQLPPLEQPELKAVIEPLMCLFYSSDVYFKVGVTKALTNLLHNWARRYQQCLRLQTPDAQDPSDSVESASGVDPSGEHLMLQKLILQLNKCLDQTLVVGLQMEGNHVLLQRAAADFVDDVSTLYKTYQLPIVCLPTNLLYRFLLSNCPDIVATMCECINNFRAAYVALKDRSQDSFIMCDTLAAATSDDSGPRTGDAVWLQQNKPTAATINSLLVDMMGILWQGRMFSGNEQLYSCKCDELYLPRDVEKPPNPYSLSVFQGPAFLGLAYKFLQEATQGQKGRRHHPSQIMEFKDVYLQYLEREGFPQFRRFIEVNLISRKTRSIQEGSKNSANTSAV